MNTLHLHNLEFTPEILSAIVEMFQQCSAKGVKWDGLFIHYHSPIPNPYLCSLLSESQNLGMFQDIDLCCSWNEQYLDEDLAEVFRDFMQATNRPLERLAIHDVSVASKEALILFQGLTSNATMLKLELTSAQLQFQDRMQVWQDAVPDFAEALLHNRSLVELNLLNCNLADNGLSIIIQSLNTHPTLIKLSLECNYGGDASLRALGGFLSSPTCALSSLDFSDQFNFDSSGSLNIAILVQEIEQNNSLEDICLGRNRLSNDDLTSLFRLLPKCPRLTTIDVAYNRISNLTLPTVNEESSRLRTLFLDGNPILDDASNDDRNTLLQLLGAHPELGYLGDDWDSETALYTPEIGHLLDLNRSGRVLLTNANIPLSVWAKVFERTNILFKDDPSRQASVIYRFLKEGPVFEFQRS
jgi:Ran GTPase-activating protein (RanGAP) involved in mRNA processing and transport